MIAQDMVVVDIQMIEVDHNVYVIHSMSFLKIKNEQKILAISEDTECLNLTVHCSGPEN